MNKIYLIDTNVLLRYILADHSQLSQKAKIFMDKIFHGDLKAIIHDGVLVECVYVLLKVYEVPREKISNVLINLLEYIGIVDKNKSIYISALKKFSNNNIDIVDNILAAFSNDEYVVASFDKDFEKLEAKMWDLKY